MVRNPNYKSMYYPPWILMIQLIQQVKEIYNSNINIFLKKSDTILNYCYRQSKTCRLQNSGSVSDQECRGTPTDLQIPIPCIPTWHNKHFQIHVLPPMISTFPIPCTPPYHNRSFKLLKNILTLYIYYIMKSKITYSYRVPIAGCHYPGNNMRQLKHSQTPLPLPTLYDFIDSQFIKQKIKT